MKRVVLGILILSTVAGAFALTSADEGVKDGAFIHVTRGGEDPHRVLMAMQMALIMSEDKDVLMYFDIKGIEPLLKDAVDLEYAHFPTSHAQLAKLLESGVTIMACPGCLKAAGKTAEDLAEGVQVADKDTFFDFTQGRILSLDY
jgi:predicted peroxiredoxin